MSRAAVPLHRHNLKIRTVTPGEYLVEVDDA